MKKGKLATTIASVLLMSSLFIGTAYGETAPKEMNGLTKQTNGINDDATHKVTPVLIKIDQAKEKQLNQKLKKAGYSDEILQEMDFDLKQHLVDQGVVKYLGTEKKEFFFDEQGKLKEKKSSSTGDVTTLGTISKTSLSLYIDTAQLATYSGKKRFTITERWGWTKDAGFRGDTQYNLVDKIGLSYSSKFDADPYTNGAYKCSHSGQYVWSGNYFYLDSCGGRPSELSYGGAGWNVDVRVDYRDYGWASMNIIAKNANTGGNYYGQFLTKYAHDTSLPYGLGLSIGPVSLSISSSGGWDEAAASKYIWY